jgi:hypothetical protein
LESFEGRPENHTGTLEEEGIRKIEDGRDIWPRNSNDGCRGIGRQIMICAGGVKMRIRRWLFNGYSSPGEL